MLTYFTIMWYKLVLHEVTTWPQFLLILYLFYIQNTCFEVKSFELDPLTGQLWCLDYMFY